MNYNLKLNPFLKKLEKAKINLQKKELLAIGAGVLIYFVGQTILGFLLFVTVANLSPKNPSQTLGSAILIIYNLLQLAVIVLAGGAVGWLARQKGLIWGGTSGLIIAAVVSLLAIFTPSQQAPPGSKLIASILNGLFLIALTAFGGRFGEKYYQKRNQTLTGK